MDEKFWLKSKTILSLIPLIGAGLTLFVEALLKWISEGHTIGGAIQIVWPALMTLLATMAAIFRAKATTTLTTDSKAGTLGP